MPRLPAVVARPLRVTADVAAASASVLDNVAQILRVVAGPGQPPAAPPRPAPTRGQTPPTRQRAAAPSAEEDHTLGRTHAERREPTPEPATGASAASAGRAPSTPKGARNVRSRRTTARSIDSVETGPAKGRGGRPSTGKAENVPSERAAKRAGRQPAPMGSQDGDA